MKNVAIFGSTGSIGESTLNVIRENKDLFNIGTLVAGKNINKLIEQIEEFKPKNVYIIDKENSDILKEKYKDKNILLVTHGGVARAVYFYFNELPKDGMLQEFGSSNCGITEYDM